MSLRACEIIYFCAVLLSKCQCLLFPVKCRSLSARLCFSTAGFNILTLVLLLGFLVTDCGCITDSFHLCVARGTRWVELCGTAYGLYWMMGFEMYQYTVPLASVCTSGLSCIDP